MNHPRMSLALVCVAVVLVAGCGTSGSITTQRNSLGQEVRVLSGMQVRNIRPKSGTIDVRMERIEQAKELRLNVTGHFASSTREEGPAWEWQNQEVRLANDAHTLLRLAEVRWEGQEEPEGILHETLTVLLTRDELLGALGSEPSQLLVCAPSASTVIVSWRRPQGCRSYQLSELQVQQMRLMAQ